jgi:hypothetical protein
MAGASTRNSFSGKDAIRRRLEEDGFDPSDFSFYFANEFSTEGLVNCCRFEDLPENLDSFCCWGRDGWPLYNYDQEQNPAIVRIDRPSSEEE